MLLEKYEDFLELSVKQFVIQPRSYNVWFVQNQTLMLLVTQLARYLLYRTRVM